MRKINAKTIAALLIAALSALAAITNTAQAQTAPRPNAVQMPDGNYRQAQAKRDTTAPVNTGKLYTDRKGNVYPVYQGAKGGLFIIRTSAKTGKTYRQYIKL